MTAGTCKAMASGVNNALAVAALLFLLVWVFRRARAVLLNKSVQLDLEDFASLLMPTASAAVRESVRQDVVAPLHGGHRTLMEVHVAVGAVLALSGAVQFVPWIRNNAFFVHTVAGNLYLVCSAIVVVQTSYILLAKDMIALGPVVWMMDVLSLVVIAVCVYLGSVCISRRELTRHRAMMICASGGVYFNPCQRLFWALLTRIGYGAPYAAYQDIISGPANTAAVAAAVVCAGVAWYYAVGPGVADVPIPKRFKRNST